MKSKLISFLAAGILSFGISLSSWADDIDIYVGSNQGETVYSPNILFIIDNSISMRRETESISRLNRVQTALNNVLEKSTNLNAGLMVFNLHGGRMVYPIENIEDPADAPIIYTPRTGADDAFEINNQVDIGIANDVTSAGDSGDIGSIMRFTNGKSEVHTGLRFPNVRIPQGATINNAYLRLFSATSDSRDTTIEIRGELTPDSAPFAETSKNISNRDTTNASVSWNSDNDFPAIEMAAVSPAVTSIIQEVVDQNDWCGGNALSVIIEADSTDNNANKRILSIDNGGGYQAQLVVEYDQTTASGCIQSTKRHSMLSQGDNAEELSDGSNVAGDDLNLDPNANDYVGLRFNNLAIPNQATILSAELIFTASEASASGSSFTIQGLNVDNVEDFSTAPSYVLRDTAKTSGLTVSLNPLGLDEEFTTPDLTSMVQSIVNQGGWAQGNSLGFVLSNFTGSSKVYSYSGSPGKSPLLAISYKATGQDQPQTVRDQLISSMYSAGMVNRTPIVTSLLEAANYFSGSEVDYGLKRTANSSWNARRLRPARVSVESSYNGLPPVRANNCDPANLNNNNCNSSYIPEGATYISPIEDLQCQVNNHIVLLTDGAAVQQVTLDAPAVAAKLGIAACDVNSGAEACGTDIAENLADGNVSIAGVPVVTHTIGFDLNSTEFLEELSASGNGSHFSTDDADELEAIFNSILVEAKEVNTTFLAPGVAVNQNNRLSHRDELYYGVFEPSSGPVWAGNLKRFGIDGDDVVDVNGVSAIDPNTGFFKESSRSEWSDVVDGPNAGLGGAASRLGLNRNLYVFDGPGTIITSQNKLHEDNSQLTLEMLNLQSEPNATDLRDSVLKWARGIDIKDEDGDGVTDESRKAMGDPLHTQPVVVDYSETESVIFVATNQGLLHSIDTETGDENFAIMPAKLLPNLKEFYQDVDSTNHVYGLDGHMVVRRTANGKIILYLGMRRGGNTYYALDVTDKDTPKYLFSITGGEAGFEKLGQTWAKPVITKVNMGGTSKDVMIFTGGYDETQDDKVTRSPDFIGNAVYIVDADDGSLLWSASNAEDASLQLTDMQYSMPGGVAAVDRDSDGYADHMYVSDMGGQIFRFDIYNGESGGDLIKGALIANFGGDDAQNNRRFYYAPDVALVSSGDELYYGVAIGSGKRASPLDQVIDDRFYLLRDESVFSLDTSQLYGFPSSVITESTLYDATEGLLGSSDETVVDAQLSALSNSDGWMLRLTTDGEKVMASPIIIDFKVFFTTYVPAESDTNVCAPAVGSSRAYLVNLLNANAVNYQNTPESAEDNVDQRTADTGIAGIAPNANFVVSSEGDLSICLGTFCTSTTPEIDVNGNLEACTSDLDCLTDNLITNTSRVRQGSWRTEIEN